MADFTAKDVQRLRQATGAGMMDSKRALEDTSGDFDAAVKWLREKGLGSAAKRSDRENTQGAVVISAPRLLPYEKPMFAPRANVFTHGNSRLITPIVSSLEPLSAIATSQRSEYPRSDSRHSRM